MKSLLRASCCAMALWVMSHAWAADAPVMLHANGGVLSVPGHPADALSPANGGLGASGLSGLLMGHGSSSATAAVDGTDFLSPLTGCKLTGCTLSGGIALNFGGTAGNVLAIGGPLNAAAQYYQTYAGNNYESYHSLTWSGTNSGQASAWVLNTSSDTLNAEGSGNGVFSIIMYVNDSNFGGTNARGGRIVGQFQFNQTACANTAGLLHDYVGVHGTSTSSSGDGGTSSAPKGDYYGVWATAGISNGANYVGAVEAIEANVGSDTNTSMLHKSDILLSRTQVNGGIGDPVQAAQDDNFVWIFGPSGNSNFLGSKVGIQFGWVDDTQGLGYGVNAGGALIQTWGAHTVQYGVDFSSATFTGCAFKSPGSHCVDNSGDVTTGGYFKSLSGNILLDSSQDEIFFNNASGAAQADIIVTGGNMYIDGTGGTVTFRNNTLSFGTYTSVTSTSIGYIAIQDSSGNVRHLAVVP